uniref:N-acetylgalactosaminide beta-1,3-galactosyltransferase n=1 Tax=Timspurckia oligopyrenoides TaxID=708627 RepID=A0A7S0ZCD9_9RHOD|mmetsp:Transcript_12323/g.22265  ORF Transcript_12323/g.22265 Transcript_12323/m.22265 type:complete len:402 (+) Transcript_12323:166-1371(+)
MIHGKLVLGFGILLINFSVLTALIYSTSIFHRRSVDQNFIQLSSSNSKDFSSRNELNGRSGYSPNSQPSKSSATDDSRSRTHTFRSADDDDDTGNEKILYNIHFGITTRDPAKFSSSLFPSIVSTWATNLSKTDSITAYVGKYAGNLTSEIDPISVGRERSLEISRAVKPEAYTYSKNDNVWANENLQIVRLPGVFDEEYPAVWKNVAQWEHMAASDVQNREYNWSVRCDDDVFINVPRLRSLLARFNPSMPYYFGKDTGGIPDEREILAFPPNASYSSGGLGQIWSRAANPYVANCRRSVEATLERVGPNHTHDDVEFGRCLVNQGVKLNFAIRNNMREFVRNQRKTMQEGPKPMEALTNHSALLEIPWYEVAICHPVKAPEQFDMLFQHVYSEEIQSPK